MLDPIKKNVDTLLQKALHEATIPLIAREMSPKMAYQLHPDYKTVDYKWFRSRLLILRKRITTGLETGLSDLEAMKEDRKKFPIKTQYENGNYRWQGSEAEAFLRQDMEQSNHIRMKPSVLHSSREAYYKFFPLHVFRKHIAQEVKNKSSTPFFMVSKQQSTRRRRRKLRIIHFSSSKKLCRDDYVEDN